MPSPANVAVLLVLAGRAAAFAPGATQTRDTINKYSRLSVSSNSFSSRWGIRAWPWSTRDELKIDNQLKGSVEDRLNKRGYGFLPAFDELHLGDRLPHDVERENSIDDAGTLPWVKKVEDAVPWLKKAWFDNDATPISIFRTCSLAFIVAFFSFPVFSKFLSESKDLQSAVSAGLVPAIGTLYGTMQAFTISLLTERKRAIQVAVGQECAALSLLTRHSIDLYRTLKVDNATMTRALRPLWDHSTTLICKTRGEELLDLVESDPCYRTLRVNAEIQSEALHEGSKYDPRLALSDVRLYEFNALVSKLSDFRAVRLSQESFPLPSVVFLFLGVLGSILAYSFALLVTPAATTKALVHTSAAQVTILSWFNPLFALNYFMTEVLATPQFLFALLVACLTLVGDFSRDMNRPFTGIYQVKHAVPTSMLLQVRKTILSALPESEHTSLTRGDKFAARIATIKRLKYPMVASLLGSDDAVTPIQNSNATRNA